MLTRVVMTAACSWLLAAGAAGQTGPPAATPAAPNVVGLSGVAFTDWSTTSKQVSANTYVQAGEVWRFSGGGEVFVGRHVFTMRGLPVALELPVAYVPRVAQAPEDPFFDVIGLDPDAAYGALYVVPRLAAAYPAGGRWHLVASMGVGVAWFDSAADARRDREVGYPLSTMLGVGGRFGRRWSARVGVGAYTHLRTRDRTTMTFTAGIVRHF